MPETALVPRSEEVLTQIKSLRGSLVDTYLTLGRLFEEVIENRYYRDYGYASFPQWLGEAKLDIGERNALYLAAVTRRQRELGLSDQAIRDAGWSNAKAILAEMSPEYSTPEVAARLLEEAKDKTVREVKAEIGAIEGRSSIVVHFKFDQVAWDEVIEPALERVKDDMAQDNVSNSRAFELLCAEYMSCATPQRTFDIEAL